MIERIRAMPGGIRLLLVYALLILVGITVVQRGAVSPARKPVTDDSSNHPEPAVSDRFSR